MQGEISVRQWQKQYHTGDFDGGNISPGCGFSRWSSFRSRKNSVEWQRQMAEVIMDITSPFLLDQCHIQFFNDHSERKFECGSVWIKPFDGKGKCFAFSLDSLQKNARWVLYMVEPDGSRIPEFRCGDASSLAYHINRTCYKLKDEGPLPPPPLRHMKKIFLEGKKRKEAER